MSLRDIAYQEDYRSGEDNILDDFFRPSLSNANEYWRAVGYFSSSALEMFGQSLGKFVQNGGSIRLITSVELREEDVTAIQRGLDKQEVCAQRIEQIIEEEFTDGIGDGVARLGALLELGRLEIQIAIPKSGSGIYHEKVGLFFSGDDYVAFSGSTNESRTAFEENYECVDVYPSWLDAERAERKRRHFEKLWKNESQGADVYSFPEAAAQKLIRIAKNRGTKKNRIETDDKKWRHQDEAIAAFLDKKAGILEMATGTGKTRTAIRILSKLVNENSVNGAIVCTEGTDLLMQWSQEIDNWISEEGMDYVSYRHFDKFHELGEFALDPRQSILLVSRIKLAAALNRISEAEKARMIIIHDEVHGLGSPGMRESLAGQHHAFGFRLGLSATPERAYDEEGNKFIEREVGPTFFEFPLEKAISRGILCEFDYFPLEYQLTSNDRDRLQQVYAKQAARKHAGNPMTKEEVWIEISKVYKTAEMKPVVFRNTLKNDQSIIDQCIIFVETKEYGNKILEILHPYTHLYRTYYAEDDQNHLLEFSSGRIDCLVTCHKLSQGIDIRSLKNVILFSSARSKLETIQRIGRCLRVDPQNPDKRAQVTDFVRSMEDEGGHPSADEERRGWLEQLSLVKKRGSC